MDNEIVVALVGGFIGLISAIIINSIQTYYGKKRENEVELFVERRKYYEQYLLHVLEGIHIVKTRKENTSLDYKLKSDQLINIMWLYGSDDVLTAMYEYYTRGDDDSLRKLIHALRRDLDKKTKKTASDVNLLRAT